MPDAVNGFDVSVRVAARVDVAFGRTHEHGLTAHEIIAVVAMLVRLGPQRMLVVDDARVVNRKDDFALREVARGEDAEAVNL